MTRDSKVLRFAQLAAIVLGIVAATITKPADYGLSPIAIRWIALVATLVGTISGRLSTSPLPGENDPCTIKTSSLRSLLLPLVIVGSGLLLVNCGTAKPVQLPASLPAAVTSADEQLRAATQWTLGVMAASEGLLDESISTFEQVKSVASPSMISGTQTVFTSLNQGLKTAYVSISKGVTSWESLRATVEPIVSQAQQLRDLVATLPAPAQTRHGFSGLVKSLLAAVSSILPELLKRSGGTLAAVGA